MLDIINMPLSSKATKIIAGIFIIGIGTLFLGQALIRYDGHQRCLEVRSSYGVGEDVPLILAAMECNESFTNIFVIAAIIKGIGTVVLLFGLRNVSMVSLKRS
jgi:hypothetical protein